MTEEEKIVHHVKSLNDGTAEWNLDEMATCGLKGVIHGSVITYTPNPDGVTCKACLKKMEKS